MSDQPTPDEIVKVFRFVEQMAASFGHDVGMGRVQPGGPWVDVGPPTNAPIKVTHDTEARALYVYLRAGHGSLRTVEALPGIVNVDLDDRGVYGVEVLYPELAMAENTRLRAAARYAFALSILFPHVNTDASCERIGVPDEEPGAWGLCCSIASTFDEEGAGLIEEDDDRTMANARAVVTEFEQADDGRNEA